MFAISLRRGHQGAKRGAVLTVEVELRHSNPVKPEADGLHYPKNTRSSGGEYAVPASADWAVMAAGYAGKFAYQRKTVPS